MEGLLLELGGAVSCLCSDGGPISSSVGCLLVVKLLAGSWEGRVGRRVEFCGCNADGAKVFSSKAACSTGDADGGGLETNS